MMNASRDREMAVEKMGQILVRLITIGREQKQVMTDLNKRLKTRVDDALNELSQYLSTAEVIARFTSWTEGRKLLASNRNSNGKTAKKPAGRNYRGMGRR